VYPAWYGCPTDLQSPATYFPGAGKLLLVKVITLTNCIEVV